MAFGNKKNVDDAAFEPILDAHLQIAPDANKPNSSPIEDADLTCATAHTVQWKDVGKAKNDNDIENMVFEDVKEEKDIVAQVEKERKLKHGLSEHGSDDVIKEDSVMVKVKFNHKYDNGSLEGHYLGRKFKNSRRLEGVKIGQPQSTIENTKIHMVHGMMWFALRYMKAKESEFILPHLRLLRKLGLDEIR
ncbi:hypothetical protein Tco_0190667, partial [Tanacetum coccineum]